MKPPAEYKYFLVVEYAPKPGAKTRLYKLITRDNTCIGEIKWYCSWRQFAFFPIANTVWSAGCLDDVMDAITNIRADYEAHRSK